MVFLFSLGRLQLCRSLLFNFGLLSTEPKGGITVPYFYKVEWVGYNLISIISINERCTRQELNNAGIPYNHRTRMSLTKYFHIMIILLSANDRQWGVPT